jgi:hypothetical protein
VVFRYDGRLGEGIVGEILAWQLPNNAMVGTACDRVTSAGLQMRRRSGARLGSVAQCDRASQPGLLNRGARQNVVGLLDSWMRYYSVRQGDEVWKIDEVRSCGGAVPVKLEGPMKIGWIKCPGLACLILTSHLACASMLTSRRK